MSGTLPACRSNMKNDVCGDRRVRMDPALHQTHYITFGYLHRSYIHAHTSPAVNHLLQQEGLCNGASLLKSPCSSKHSEIKKKKKRGTSLLCPGRVTTEINHSDKSPELPRHVTNSVPSLQGAHSFFSGGLTCQQICTHFWSHDRRQTLLNNM